MLVLVTYDVSTETSEGRHRLSKVSKCCIKYGQRVQNSVFECSIDYGNFLKLKSALKEIINQTTDSLRFYNLGNNYENKVEHIGVKKTIKMDDVIVV